MPPSTMNSNRCNVCFFNKQPQHPKIKTCTGCKLISYCSFQHQKLDWPIHKNFCRAIKSIMEKKSITHPHYLNGTISDKNDLEKAIIILKHCLRYVLNRNLDAHEEELITFPKYCNICLSFKTSNEANCSLCKVICYCSEDCKSLDAEDHPKICHDLKVLYNFYEDYEFNLKLTLKYINLQMQKEENIFSVLKKLIPNDIIIPYVPDKFDEYQSFAAASTYSSVMTTLYVLDYCNILGNCREICTIYVVGVREDIYWFQEKHCKFLLSQLPNVKLLKLILIGPELQITNNIIKYSICIDGIDKEIIIEIYGERFEKYLELKNLDTTKDLLCNLLICFNCGFAEYANTPNHTWRLALLKFLEMKRTPIAFTSYTKMESKLDLKEILSVAHCNDEQYNIMIKTERNRFRDLRPLRNWEITDDDADLIFYRNGYLNVFMPKCRFT